MNGSDTGVDWNAAVYRKVQDEMKTNRGLTVDSRQPIRQPQLQGLVEDAPDRDQSCRTIPRLRSKLAALLQRVAGLLKLITRYIRVQTDDGLLSMRMG